MTQSSSWGASPEELRRIAEEAQRECAQLRAQLQQAQKLETIGRLAGGVAHDFNNLLTAIAGFNDILGRGINPADPKSRFVQEIRDTVQRAGALTRQLLAFSRKDVAQAAVADINAVASGMVRILRRLIGDDIDFTTRLSSSVLSVRMDPGPIEQVILNLCVNARDAMPSGGKLTLSTEDAVLAEGEMREDGAPGAATLPAGRYAVLSVADAGTGMDEETLSRIFEPFFTTKDAARGTGLGLSTVYGIVKRFAGYIRVLTSPGRGTAFHLYFPLAAEAPPAASAEEPEVHEKLRGKESVLLVEDDASVRAITGRFLEMNGYKLYEAKSADEAFAVFDAVGGAVDVLVTDVVMLGMKGPDLAKALRARKPGLKVLFLSGYSQADMKGQVDPADAALFLSKPFRPKDLILRLRVMLDGDKAPAGRD